MEQDLKRAMGSIRAFVLDMDGTVYLGDKLIEGSDAFIRTAERTGRAILFLTNNSSRNASYYLQKLGRLGIEVQKEQILTSGQASADFLMRTFTGRRVWVLGNEYLKEELAEAGIRVVDSNPDVLLAGYDTTLTYRKLCEFCDYVRKGLPYIATHPDFNCPVEGGFEPDLGSFMALIEASTGRRADRIIGKPEEDMAKAAENRLGLPPSNLAMCGDRLYTDIAFGKRNGMTSILVLSGETRREDVPKAQYQPDIVAEKLASLTKSL
jgi:HAD superfamily hydrolase (TIGR01450 family)